MKASRNEEETHAGKMEASDDAALRSVDEGSPTPADTVTLVSMDGDSFVVETSAIMISQLIKATVDGLGSEDAREIPLPNLRSNVLAKVVEFCKHHKAEPMKKIPKPIRYGLGVEDHVQEWYSEFLRSLDDSMLFELLLGANYLDLTPLLEICAAKIGLRIMNKTPDEVRQEFNITEEFSPEVERKLRNENKWSTEPPVGR